MTEGFAPPALFAAGLDWLEGLLPFLFLLFWIVSQVVNVIRKAAGAGDPKPVEPVRPQPPRRRPVAEGAPAGGDERLELERQIGEFLRQSRGGPPATPRTQPPAPPPPRPPKLDAVPRGGTRSVTARREASTVKRPPASTDRDSTAVGRHVHDAFAHDLRHLESPLAGPEADLDAAVQRPPVNVAAELTAALRNPATVRQLILLREVLERPVDRW
jgi:hypothetical protein